MTDKEALNQLYLLAVTPEKAMETQFYCDIIEKDLEVLEILKKSIFNKEEHIRRMSEPKGEPFLMLNLHVNGEENIKKVKEILK